MSNNDARIKYFKTKIREALVRIKKYEGKLKKLASSPEVARFLAIQKIMQDTQLLLNLNAQDLGILLTEMETHVSDEAAKQEERIIPYRKRKLPENVLIDDPQSLLDKLPPSEPPRRHRGMKQVRKSVLDD